MHSQTDVKVGQIWSDKDKRRQGRQLRVEQINEDSAQCSIRQGEDGEFGRRLTRIKLDRFARYQLLKDVEQQGSPESESGTGASPADEETLSETHAAQDREDQPNAVRS